jgi:hypothetical protein
MLRRRQAKDSRAWHGSSNFSGRQPMQRQEATNAGYVGIKDSSAACGFIQGKKYHAKYRTHKGSKIQSPKTQILVWHLSRP